jgi:tRNA dimethylallyltransferase
MTDRPKISRFVAILGPTATGKTSLALRIASSFDGEIVSTDALQVYRSANIGTAKPTAEECRMVQHHCIDLVEPNDQMSSAQFEANALKAVVSIEASGKLPVLVGGSGHYYRAITQGSFPTPEIPESIRKSLQAKLDKQGIDAMYTELRYVDPQRARQLHPNDTYRIMRALEVHAATGTPYSKIAQDHTPTPLADRNLLFITNWPADRLRERIAERTDTMLKSGWIDEVHALRKRGVADDSAVMKSVGYRQIVNWLQTGGPQEELRQEIITATCQYAKRQRTWFRNQFPDPGENGNVVWISEKEAGSNRAIDLVRNFLEKDEKPGNSD